MKATVKLFILLFFATSVSMFAQTTFKVDESDGRNQATFISDAPLEKIVGIASGISADLVLNISDITDSPSGTVIVPIEKLKTGIELRDEHLQSENWMNVAKYPTAEFKLTGITSPSAKELTDKAKLEVQLTGDLMIHGVTKTVTVPGELVYLKESDLTKKRLEGNLLRGSAEFAIKLSDYGITIPDMVVGKLSEEVLITIDFVSSDAL